MPGVLTVEPPIGENYIHSRGQGENCSMPSSSGELYQIEDCYFDDVHEIVNGKTS